YLFCCKAESGSQYRIVTGVQTCALPISFGHYRLPLPRGGCGPRRGRIGPELRCCGGSSVGGSSKLSSSSASLMLLPRRGLGASVSGSASTSHSKVPGGFVVPCSLFVPGALGTRGAADLVARRIPRGLIPAPRARN